MQSMLISCWPCVQEVLLYVGEAKTHQSLTSTVYSKSMGWLGSISLSLTRRQSHHANDIAMSIWLDLPDVDT
jgi:hypothetical protein